MGLVACWAFVLINNYKFWGFHFSLFTLVLLFFCSFKEGEEGSLVFIRLDFVLFFSFRVLFFFGGVVDLRPKVGWKLLIVN